MNTPRPVSSSTASSTASPTAPRPAAPTPARAPRRRGRTRPALAGAVAAVLLAACAAPSPTSPAAAAAGPAADRSGMGFFVTSANPGRGGDLGGLAGADRHCQALAGAAGAGRRTWRAYLSQQPVGSAAGVDARDRIGSGPWRNARGVVVATDIGQLHGPSNNLNKDTALTERGETVRGRGDTPNDHDILTGSQPDGRHIAGGANSTCANWTQDSGGAAMVGHHDRRGLNESAPMLSWNSSHQSRGCSLPELRATGGGGLFYCFAAD